MKENKENLSAENYIAPLAMGTLLYPLTIVISLLGIGYLAIRSLSLSYSNWKTGRKLKQLDNDDNVSQLAQARLKKLDAKEPYLKKNLLRELNRFSKCFRLTVGFENRHLIKDEYTRALEYNPTIANYYGGNDSKADQLVSTVRAIRAYERVLEEKQSLQGQSINEQRSILNTRYQYTRLRRNMGKAIYSYYQKVCLKFLIPFVGPCKVLRSEETTKTFLEREHFESIAMYNETVRQHSWLKPLSDAPNDF